MAVNNITIKDSLYFEFNNRKSNDFQMMNVTLSGGMQEEYFASSQSINEEKTRGRSKPYFYSAEKEPLKINVTFARGVLWTRDELREMRRWLTEPEYYSPLTFSNDPEKIYYAMYIDDPSLTHTINSGYITLSFRCNDAYAYSPIMTKKYEWNYTGNYDNLINNFSTGSSSTMIIDGNGYIGLNPMKKKLSDYARTVKLYEIG